MTLLMGTQGQSLTGIISLEVLHHGLGVFATHPLKTSTSTTASHDCL